MGPNDVKRKTTPTKDPKTFGAPMPLAPASETGRTLVLCFDGTSNEFDDTNTNVVKLFSFLEKENPKQHVYYQTGVGTYIGPGFTNPVGKWIAKAADLAVAWYLDEHIMGGYRFLQAVWQPDDRICLFGFSRGAYTARALAGMLYRVGLLPPEMPEQVDFAYSIFKAGTQSAAYKHAFSRTVTIEFLGVWDTVSSVGGVIPRVLPFSADNHITKTFRHALALDEHRAKFRSNTWHLTPDSESKHHPEDGPQPGIVRAVWHKFTRIFHRSAVKHQAALDEERSKLDMEGGLIDRPPTDVKEVWFPGCHCDVGGGNTPDKAQYALSNVPLRWMIKEILIADPKIIFRKSEMTGQHGINYDHLAAFAAAQKKAESDCVEVEPDLTETLTPPEAEVIPQHQGDATAHTTVDGSQEPEAENPQVNGNDTTPTAQPGKEKMRWRNDAISSITDALVITPAWWLLEFFLFIDSKQDEYGHWTNYVRMNRGRGRDIPKPPAHSNPNSKYNDSSKGVNISDAPALFHLSVKQRMESPDCNVATWRSFWRKKNKPYKPRAWPKTGNPVYVE